MKKTKQLFAHIFILSIALLCLTNCRDLDLDSGNIEYDTSLALPIGTVKAGITDIIDGVDVDFIVKDTVNNSLFMLWKEDSKYIDFNFANFNVGDTVEKTIKLKNNPTLDALFSAYPGIDINLNAIPYDINISDNNYYNFGYNEENLNRTIIVDSCHIVEACFTIDFNLTGITLDPNNPIEAKITFPTITDTLRNVITTTLTKNNQTFVTPTLHNFKITFPNDSNTIPMNIEFKLNKNSNIIITNDAKISLSTVATIFVFESIFGFYQSTNPVFTDDITMEIPTDLFNTNFVQNSNLTFANPMLKIDITNNLGIPIDMSCDSIFAKDEEGNTVFADFNGSTKLTKTIPSAPSPGDSAKLSIKLDKDYGATNKLFEILPKIIHYKWEANIAKPAHGEIPYHFLRDKTKLKVDICTEIPFEFNPGAKINFSDTLLVNLDSLLISLSDSLSINDLAISLNTENMLPSNVNLKVIFLDENDSTVFSKDDLCINSASVDTDGKAIEPSKQRIDLTFKKDQLNSINSTNKILIDISLTPKDNYSKMNLQLSDYVKLKVGLFVNAGLTF